MAKRANTGFRKKYPNEMGYKRKDQPKNRPPRLVLVEDKKGNVVTTNKGWMAYLTTVNNLAHAFVFAETRSEDRGTALYVLEKFLRNAELMYDPEPPQKRDNKFYYKMLKQHGQIEDMKRYTIKRK